MSIMQKEPPKSVCFRIIQMLMCFCYIIQILEPRLVPFELPSHKLNTEQLVVGKPSMFVRGDILFDLNPQSSIWAPETKIEYRTIRKKQHLEMLYYLSPWDRMQWRRRVRPFNGPKGRRATDSELRYCSSHAVSSVIALSHCHRCGRILWNKQTIPTQFLTGFRSSHKFLTALRGGNA